MTKAAAHELSGIAQWARGTIVLGCAVALIAAERFWPTVTF